MQPAQHYGEAQSLSDGASDHQRRSTQTHKTAATTDDIEHMIATVNGIWTALNGRYTQSVYEEEEIEKNHMEKKRSR